MVDSISFTNYKSFKNNQTLILKPITVLIGKNSSGKSAISKLLPLLSDSLSGKFAPPLKWEARGVKVGLSNKDLVYNRAITSIMDLKVTSGNEVLEVSIGVDIKDRPSIYKWVYNNNAVEPDKFKFQGLTLKEYPFQSLDIMYDYIGPFREIPQSGYSNSFETYDSIGTKGHNAYPLLIQSFNNGDGLLNSVSKWYQNNFEGWRIEVVELTAPEPTFQIVLSNKEIKQINIVNVGQGMNQALPLIVRSYMPQVSEVRIIIEEPETHLHPAAHGSLAERFAESYKENSNRKYLIETHSPNFVLRLRRMVAEGKLNKEDLAIYYVDFLEETNESILSEILVDDSGGVKSWPEGVFSETLTETRAIKDAQLKDTK